MTQREVVLEGGGPWGFRMHGGTDVNQPLRISRVNPGSKASLKGVREGDLISSINGQSTKEITNSEAHALLKKAGDQLKLSLNEDCASNKRRNKSVFMHQHQTQETLSESSKSRTTCTTDTTIISCDNGRSSGNKCKSRTSDNEKSSSSSLTTSPTSTLSSSTAKSSDTKDRTKAPKKSQKQQEMETEESPGNYRVDSPQSSVSKEEKRSSIAKSRSLDSDETLKIVELKGDNENLESNCTELVNNAIITEIESDWELTNDLTLKSINHAVVNEVVNGVEKCQDFDRLSQTVRNGTIVTELTNEETLPDEFSANIEDLRKERLSKLVEYFGPVYPRCLDVISEEGSDLSDSSVAVTQTKVECCLPEFVHLSDTSESDTEICDDLLDDALENSLQNQFFELNFKEEIDTDKGELVNFDIKKFCEELIDEILDNAESFLEKQFCDLNIKKNISSFKISKDSEEIEKDADNLHKTEETVEKDNENSKIFIDNYLNEILEEVFTEKEPVETAIKENSSLEQKTTNLQENKNLESTELITEKEKMKSSLGINKKTIFLTEEPKNKDSDASDEEIISYFQRKETKSEESKSSDSDASTVKHFSPQNPQIKLLKTNPLTLKDLCFSTLNDLNLNSIPELLQKIFNDSSSAEEVEEVIVNTENTENYSKEVTETFKEEHCVLEEIDENASRRLLDIIKKEKNPLLENAVPFFEDSEYLHEARSRARDLDEWLQLTTFGRNRNTPRSRSLPAEVHVRQMQLLIAQEKHLQEDLERLEAQKRVLLSAMTLDAKRSEVSAVKEDPQVPNSIEKKRLQMYQEYLDEWHSRQQRRHDKLIRISLNENQDFSSSSGAQRGAQNEIEREFMEKLRQKQRKVEKADSEEEEETNRVQVIDEGEIYHRKLPKHLQEFVEITTREQNVDGDGGSSNRKKQDALRINKVLKRNRPLNRLSLLQEIDSNLILARGFLFGRGVWSPGQKSNFDPEDLKRELSIETNPADFADESIAPVWSPRSAASSPTAERKEFRPVPFESPVLARKSKLKTQEIQKADPPWKTHPLESSRLPSSFSSPGFNNSPEFATRLPKAQNPTITLLQKAREGQIPKSATYIEQERIRRKHESPYNSNSDLVYELRTESISDSDSERPKKGPRKVDSNTIHHMPFGLRSEAKNDQMSQWYKKMYHTMNKQHPNKYEDDEYVLIRYKQRNRAGRYPFATGYLSEPEAGAYDSDADYNKYATLDRRRTPFANVPSVSTLKSSISKEKSPDKSFTYKDTTTISYKPETQKVSSPPYKPKPIEYYRPGESSIAETEAKRWWDEVMDIFDGWLHQHNSHQSSSRLTSRSSKSVNKSMFLLSSMEKQQNQQRAKVMHQLPTYQTKGYLSQALKESGYESDSTLVFRRREDGLNQQLASPSEQKEQYKSVQKGGDVPLYGLRKPAPEKPRDHIDDDDIECIPLSPTLNRLRVHKSPKYQQNILCYPVKTIHFNQFMDDDLVTKVKPSSVVRSKPPSPPRRKSSRNNSTLRMIHNMRPAKLSPLSRRHQSCLTDAKNTKVKALKEQISGQLNAGGEKKSKKSLSKSSCSCKNKNCKLCFKTVSKSSKKSPVEIKKAVVSQINSLGKDGSKNGSNLLAKAKTGSKSGSQKTKFRNVTSPVSMISSTSRSSLDSLRSSPTLPHIAFGRSITPKPTKTIKKSKKDLMNHNQKNTKKSKISKGLLTISEKPSEESKFFQKLFLGDSEINETSIKINNNNYIIQNNNFDCNQKTDFTFGALKHYLNHTKPVSESKFKQFDVRARSISPKNISSYYLNDHERSISLPPRLIFTKSSPKSKMYSSEDNLKKIVFTETSRPVSPMLRQRVPTPPESPRTLSPCSGDQMMYFSETSRPVSPVITRRSLSPPKLHSSPSPSSRRIRALKRSQKVDRINSINKERFMELNQFYSNLERLHELEKLNYFSIPRRKFADSIVDYERWQFLRNKEKAERELTSLYRQLKQDQRDKDFLFRPKYPETTKWKPNLDRGLRVKEKSVQNLREEFEMIRKCQMETERKLREELSIKRGVYKPLWRGNSVVNLAQIMDERRSKSESRIKNLKEKLFDSDNLLTHGIGSRIWSSLSMEQVNILKNQLSEIYGNDKKFSKSSNDPCVIEVKKSDVKKVPKELTVRRNSFSDAKPPKYRSQSAGPQLSEDEKRKLSQSISKEVLERQKLISSQIIQAKETLGAYAASKANVTQKPSKLSKEKKKDSEFSIVLTKDDGNSIESNLEIFAKPKEALISTECLNTPKVSSETESTEDGSIKTVILNVPKKKVKEKVNYFETQHEREVYTPIIYKPADDPVEEDHNGDVLYRGYKICKSQSEQDLKELFGETNLYSLTSEPLSSSRKYKYSPPNSPILRSSIRSRSLSPVNVLQLTRKFEEHQVKQILRRSNSDADIKSEHVKKMTSKFEYPHIAGRGRSRYKMRPGVVSPGFLKAEDRYMPHINIISKIASLYPNKKDEPLSRSNEDLAKILGIPLGEVHKLRERFDSEDNKKMSILGHMFTSSPNINELRDVAQYLTGSWIAHKYPKVEDNEIPIGRRTKSASPVRSTSILKQGRKYRPFRSWWNANEITFYKPSVHFKEPEGPPPPPPSNGTDEKINAENVSETESPRKYVENEVTIHYRTPVRQEIKEMISEDELRRRQADAMRKIYEEERQRKYLQVSHSSHSDNEIQDMKSRRHTDNFTPSQKSPISLNRYDDFVDDLSPRATRAKSPEPRLIAKALYNFLGQSAKELTFKKGDIIFIRRQVDKNWYEGEINAMIGLFPANYVEIVPYDGFKTTSRKPHEGQARAKYNFIAQTHLELSLAKGELVVITRRVDDNWFEGRVGGRKGIFPVSYVEVLVDPGVAVTTPSKPVASPAAHSLVVNGRESLGAHNYVPSFPPVQGTQANKKAKTGVQVNGTYGTLNQKNLDQALHIDIQNEPIPYRAMYKYKPQNEDELELLEGDKVLVLEKCDDGWYVGTSERTGAFGTFPGNYVERI